MQFFLVGADWGDERGLGSVAEDVAGAAPVRLPDLDALRRDARFRAATRSLVLLPTAPGQGGATDAALEAASAFVGEFGDHAFVVCFADTIAPDRYKRLLRTGHAEWIAWDGFEADFRELAARLNAAPSRTVRETAGIVSFLPSKGGVGNSTLVVETAYGLSVGRRHWPGGTRRGAAERRIAVLDLNWQGGTVADALDIEARFDMAGVMRQPERLDEHLVDAFASRHVPSGLDVFACPPSRLGIDGVPPEIVFTVIDAVASRYDTLLLDCPASWLSWTEHLLHGSDGVVVTGGESVPALRRLKATLEGVDASGLDAAKLAVAVNEVATDLLGRPAGRGVVEKALSGRRTFLVRRDDDGLRTALDAGRPATELAPGGRLARDTKGLAAWVARMAARSPDADAPVGERADKQAKQARKAA